MKKERLVILGGGESGVGSAYLGKKEGFDVFLSDQGTLKQEYRDRLNEYGIAFEEGRHSEELILTADLVVKSPGIPDKAPLIVALHAKGIPVISEIEFAGRYTDARMICITGSNGKTTTTMLTYEIFRNAGLNAGLAGNVGKSFAYQVATEKFDYYVLELSSFQLDGMYSFRAHVAILTNITPDHLDRYDYKMQNYVNAKLRILQNQTEEDYFIYSDDDPVLTEALKGVEIKAQRLPYSINHPLTTGGWTENDQIKLNVNNKNFDMNIYDLALQGKHNLSNSMAAGLAGTTQNIRKESIRESLSDFKGVEHRLERYMRVHDIEFINDSKATNVNSVWYALESMPGNVIWIVGGIDKGNDYSELYELVSAKVKAIVCLGVDNHKIVEAFKGRVKEIVETRSMEEAVRSSYFLATKGDTVLLSPACASFDLFKNYEERGRQFKEAVRNL